MNQFRPRSALVPTPTPDRLQAGSIPPPTNYQRNIEHGVRGKSALTRPHTVMGNRDVNVLSRNTGADSGAPSSHHDVASMCLNPMDERLSGVRQGIANLSLTLQCDMDAKRQYEETRMYELRQITEKMERHLALEVKRRTESDRALQALVEHKIQDAVENMNVAVTHKFQMLQQDIDILTRKLEQTCNELAVEREKNQRLTQELRQQYAEGFEGIQKIFERERAQRLEKEATLLRRLSEDVRCLAERVDVEHYARETGLRQLKEDVIEGWSKQNSQVDSEKFRIRILEELQCLRNALRLETEAREKGEVSLAATMQELVVQVQEGLRFASS